MSFFFKKKQAITPHLSEPMYLPYRGGELLGFFLDNFKDDTELIKDTILKNEKLCNRPSMPSLVSYELIDTKVTAEVAEFLVESIMRMNNNIKKMAFVGATRQGRKYIENCLAKYNNDINFAFNFFNGYEPAKEWLIPGK